MTNKKKDKIVKKNNPVVPLIKRTTPPNSYLDGLKKQLDFLMNEIKKISNRKVLTLLSMDNELTCILEMDENGSLGDFSYDEAIFRAHLLRVLTSSGSLLIREQLMLRIEIESPSGHKFWTSLKNMYGIALGNNRWKGLTADEMRMAYAMDFETLKPLPPEPDVMFCSFPPSKN